MIEKNNHNKGYEPMTSQLGVPGTSYNIELGLINEKWAVRLLKGKDIIDSYVFAFLKRYCYKIFNPSERLNIGVDFHYKTVELDNKRFELHLWNLGEEERFRILLPTYCLGANGAFFLYDITDQSSLNRISEWKTIIRQKTGDIPIVLIGTKLDLQDRREISRDDGILIAKNYNLASFLEVSSKTGENIQRAFEIMINELIEKHSHELSKFLKASHSGKKKIEKKKLEKPKIELDLEKIEFEKDFIEIQKRLHRRREWRKGGDFPFPYIFKPPKPPDDLALAGEEKPKKLITEQVLEDKPYCKHCGAELPKGQTICHVCGKKTL